MGRGPIQIATPAADTDGLVGLPVLQELPAAVRPERADAARNRQAILCAAARLIAERGIDGVTMDDVSCAAGVGKGTLFRRFGDRPTLLRALLDDRERAFQDAFIRGEAPLGPGAPPQERLVAFGHGLLELVEVQGDLLAAAEAGSPGLRLRHRVYATYRAHVRSLLRQAAAAGSEADVDYLVDVLLATLAVDVVLYQRRDQGLSLERIQSGWAALCRAVVP